MKIILMVIFILYVSKKKFSSADDSVIYDKCDPDNYYKPYAKVLMKMSTRPIKQLAGTGFLILSGYNRVILCLNGPAFLYKEVELENSDDAINSAEPEPKAYTNGSLGVYEHYCMPINQILKKDLMSARAGHTKGIIQLSREVYGVYLVGNMLDYRLPELVQFNNDHLNYIPPSKLPSQLLGHSFAMIGSAPGDAFCTTVTNNNSASGNDKSYNIRVSTQPGKIVGPHVSIRRGIDSGIDDLLKDTLTSLTVWTPCNKRPVTKKPAKPLKKGKSNLTMFDHFATYGHGNHLENSQRSEENPTVIIFGTTPKPELVCAGFCELTLTDRTKQLPILEKSSKCDPRARQGRLTDNPCYFWRYTADVYIKLEDAQRLHWRQNLMDEVRKIMQMACPMVPPLLIILAHQIVTGYFSKLILDNQPQNIKYMDRMHSQWAGELLDNLILCRSQAKPMEFNYSILPMDPNFSDETYYTHSRKYVHPHPGSTLYYHILQNATRDPDDFEDAPHIEDRKPPLASDTYRQEFPRDIQLLKDPTTAIPLFYHREGVELETELNYAIDVAWKAFATAIGYCNVFYQAKKPEIFPRLYNAFYEDLLEALSPYWTSTADNDHIRLFLEEFMDNDSINLWLDSCLEASYIFSDSNTYRPPRPLLFNEDRQHIANYFLELPSDVPILSPEVTNPLNNLRRSTKFKRELDAKERKLFNRRRAHHKKQRIPHSKHNYKYTRQHYEKVNHARQFSPISAPVPAQTPAPVHVRPKGRIMG